MPEPIEFSIIIPTAGRPTALGECLKALAQLDYPRSRFEVIVVEDERRLGEPVVAASLVGVMPYDDHIGSLAARFHRGKLAWRLEISVQIRYD